MKGDVDRVTLEVGEKERLTDFFLNYYGVNSLGEIYQSDTSKDGTLDGKIVLGIGTTTMNKKSKGNGR